MANPSLSTGDGPPQGPSPSKPTVGMAGSQALAFSALSGDSKLILSDPSKVLLDTLGTALEELKTAGIDIMKTQAMSLVDNIAMEVIGTTVSDVIAGVPMIGAFVGAVVKIFQMVFGVDHEAVDKAYCQLFQSMKPPQTGSILAGGESVPADTFARVHQTPEAIYASDTFGKFLWYPPQFRQFTPNKGSAQYRGFLPGVVYYRSALGMAIMAALEGCPVDVNDISFVALTNKSPWSRWLQAYEGLTAKQARSLWKVQMNTQISSLVPGLSRDEREQFMKIRRGIESCYGPTLPPGTSSDGGVALWTGFMDLFLGKVKSGGIDRYKIAAWLSRWPMFGDPDVSGGCIASMAGQVMSISAGWEHAIHPYYSQGQSKLAEISAQASEIAAKTAKRAVVAGQGKLAKGRSIGQVTGQLDTMRATMDDEDVDMLDIATAGFAGPSPDVGDSEGMPSPDLASDLSQEGPPGGDGGFQSAVADFAKNIPVKDIATFASDLAKPKTKADHHGHAGPAPFIGPAARMVLADQGERAKYWKRKFEEEREKNRHRRLIIKPKSTDASEGSAAVAPIAVPATPPPSATPTASDAMVNKTETHGDGVKYALYGGAALAVVATVAVITMSSGSPDKKVP